MRYSTKEFENIYRRCFPPAMKLAMSLLHHEDEARDAVQEVFLKLWESETRIDNPPAFILRAVRNTCLNRLSSLDTREKIRQRITLEPPPDDTDIAHRHEEIRSAISKILTQREQQIVDRIYSDEMTYKQAAETLGVSVSAINKNIVSALKKLRNHFKTRQ